VSEPADPRYALLAQLEEEERSVSSRRRKLHERIAMFPDAGGDLEGRERELSQERRELHARIDNLREELRDAESSSPSEPSA
jgi:chromosome segregation ATPase